MSSHNSVPTKPLNFTCHHTTVCLPSHWISHVITQQYAYLVIELHMSSHTKTKQKTKQNKKTKGRFLPHNFYTYLWKVWFLIKASQDGRTSNVELVSYCPQELATGRWCDFHLSVRNYNRQQSTGHWTWVWISPSTTLTRHRIDHCARCDPYHFIKKHKAEEAIQCVSDPHLSINNINSTQK